MRKLLALIGLLALSLGNAATTITYQGQLQHSGEPSNETFPMTFRLYDSLTEGSQIGDAESFPGVPVSDGLFQIKLDFGPGVFADAGRFLEIEIDGVVLSPRQQITASPLATHALTVSGEVLGDLSCSSGQLPKWSGTSWSCGNDIDTNYSAGAGMELSGTRFSLDTEFTDGLYWRQGGNAGTTPLSDFIGTSDFTRLEIHVDNQRALRIEPTGEGAAGDYDASNIIGGHRLNIVDADVVGATIAGGGQGVPIPRPNTISGNYGTIGGGLGNIASRFSVVSGGDRNTASGSFSSIGGGFGGTASGNWSTVPGGSANSAIGSYSFAAGRLANADHDGAFVWSDSSFTGFNSTADDQFLVRARGGFGVNTNEPMRGGLHVKQQVAGGGPSQIGLVMERSGTSTNNWAFYVATSANLGFRFNDDLVARIDTSGEFATLSDARHKTDIEPLAGALERLVQLEPASYRMIMGSADDPVSLGLIAQQVSQILPGAVSEEEGTLGVYYNQITALNTAALIELNTRSLDAIRGLDARLNSSVKRLLELESEKTELGERVAALEVKNAELRQLAVRNAELEARLSALESLLVDGGEVAGKLR